MNVDDMELSISNPQSAEAHHARLLENAYVPEPPERRVAKMTPALKRRYCEALANGASPTKAEPPLN